MAIKIEINLKSMLEHASPELTIILVDEYISEMNIVLMRISNAASDVAAREQLFSSNPRAEYRIMDTALEEACARLRPKYARYKFICDWLYAVPREARPCLEEARSKLAALQEVRRRLKEVFGR